MKFWVCIFYRFYQIKNFLNTLLTDKYAPVLNFIKISSHICSVLQRIFTGTIIYFVYPLGQLCIFLYISCRSWLNSLFRSQRDIQNFIINLNIKHSQKVVKEIHCTNFLTDPSPKPNRTKTNRYHNFVSILVHQKVKMNQVK